MAPPKAGDMRAGIVGLIVSAVFLLVVLTGIVHLTNQHYEGMKPEAAATS